MILKTVGDARKAFSKLSDNTRLIFRTCEEDDAGAFVSVCVHHETSKGYYASEEEVQVNEGTFVELKAPVAMITVGPPLGFIRRAVNEGNFVFQAVRRGRVRSLNVDKEELKSVLLEALDDPRIQEILREPWNPPE